MAKKNGIGVTRNRVASTYQATMPDGTNLKKKSFFIHTDKALMGAFLHEGKWISSGITEKIQDWGTQQFFEATRIK